MPRCENGLGTGGPTDGRHGTMALVMMFKFERLCLREG